MIDQMELSLAGFSGYVADRLRSSRCGAAVDGAIHECLTRHNCDQPIVLSGSEWRQSPLIVCILLSIFAPRLSRLDSGIDTKASRYLSYASDEVT